MRRRLLDLKAIRARVDAFDGAAEWAKRDARPSDEEIEAIQQRIRTEEDKLAHATPEQRALIDNASITLRKARAAGAGRHHPAALARTVRTRCSHTSTTAATSSTRLGNLIDD